LASDTIFHGEMALSQCLMLDIQAHVIIVFVTIQPVRE